MLHHLLKKHVIWVYCRTLPRYRLRKSELSSPIGVLRKLTGPATILADYASDWYLIGKSKPSN